MNNLPISSFRQEKTCQLTTYHLKENIKTMMVPRGQKVTLGEVNGKGYIAQLWLTFPGWFYPHWDPAHPVNQSILKTLILRIYWDHEKEPAVAAPVADFFGIGLCQIGNFANQYFGMSSGGFFCKFPMPFKQGFRIEMENLDAEVDTDVFMNVVYQLTDSLPVDWGYFHTRFNTATLNGIEPIQILETYGSGHYVGCTLAIQGKEMNYLTFLEAPEFVYIDDDWESARIYGTGLEDYFLGGWYFREGTLIGPFHGVPVKDPLNSSVAMYRIHENDAIRFTKRLRFNFINLVDPSRLKPFCYSAAAFYYLDSPKGAADTIPSGDNLLCWYRIRNTDHQSIP